MLIVTGSITPTAETFNELLALALEHIRRTRAEPGCISVSVQTDPENLLRLVFFGEWASQDAFMAHLAVPAAMEFSNRAREENAVFSEMAFYEAAPIQLS